MKSCFIYASALYIDKCCLKSMPIKRCKFINKLRNVQIFSIGNKMKTCTNE